MLGYSCPPRCERTRSVRIYSFEALTFGLSGSAMRGGTKLKGSLDELLRLGLGGHARERSSRSWRIPVGSLVSRQCRPLEKARETNTSVVLERPTKSAPIVFFEQALSNEQAPISGVQAFEAKKITECLLVNASC